MPVAKKLMCPRCLKMFGSDSAMRVHRKGKFPSYKCLTAEEIKKQGRLTLKDGVYVAIDKRREKVV